jgi:predicted anti-sigma-YlaC factor YlaD
MSCAEVAPALGAYVLGALEPDERRRVEAHLGRCPVCSEEVTEFARLPGLLDRVRPEDLEVEPVTPSPQLFDRVAAAAAAESGRPRRRVRLLVAAAAVLAVLGAGVGVIVWAFGGEEGHTVTVGEVRMTVTATAHNDGSALDVTVAGLPEGEECRLVAVDRDGGRHPAGEWTVDDGDAWWQTWTGVERSALAEVVLLGGDGRELVRVPL